MADSLSWNSHGAAGRLAPLRLRRHLVGGRMPNRSGECVQRFSPRFCLGFATPSTTSDSLRSAMSLPCHALRAVLLSRPRLSLMEPPTALGLEVALQKLSLPDASPSRARSEWLCLGVCIRSAIAYLVLLWVLSKSAAVGCWLQPLADLWLS